MTVLSFLRYQYMLPRLALNSSSYLSPLPIAVTTDEPQLTVSCLPQLPHLCFLFCITVITTWHITHLTWLLYSLLLDYKCCSMLVSSLEKSAWHTLMINYFQKGAVTEALSHYLLRFSQFCSALSWLSSFLNSSYPGQSFCFKLCLLFGSSLPWSLSVGISSMM